ncbi:hypothetical protein [Undibacterium danionis]|uniref:GIY-YIG nuclease family protein n=1 Tax=Undibacterium danionis TaxID=1812100 RepID=A0ABV6IC46_9BURK
MSDIVESFPADFYGVHVQNEIDALRLLYLVEKIGEKKLRATVKKVTDRYPGFKPFVSKLLGWYRIKVPVSVYAPIEIPVYRVYALILVDHSKIKIGYSKNWVKRASNFHISSLNPADLFDLDKSFSVLVGAKIADAKELELKALNYFRQKPGYQTTPPANLMYSATGTNEWFAGHAFLEIEHFLLNCDVNSSRSQMRLSDAIALHELHAVSVD